MSMQEIYRRRQNFHIALVNRTGQFVTNMTGSGSSYSKNCRLLIILSLKVTSNKD